MKSFEYHSPHSLEEALSILSSRGGEAKVLAGGTDLILQMKDGRQNPSVIVDVKGLSKVRGLDFNKNTLRIGAAVPLAMIAGFSPVQKQFSMLQTACGLIGSMQLRNRATAGGNVCNAAPSGDTAPSFLCLGATAIVARKGGTRKVPMHAFFRGPGQSVLEKDELLLGFEVPAPGPSWSGCYLRHTPRQHMDISVAGVAVLLDLQEGGKVCREARIALASVAPTPLRAADAEKALAGQSVSDRLIEEAADLAARSAKPISDVRGSAEYRIDLVRVLTVRAIRRAIEAHRQEESR